MNIPLLLPLLIHAGILPMQAAMTETHCIIANEPIPIGVEFLLPQPEPAYIDAIDPDTPVSVRTGPGRDFEAIATGESGDYVDIIGQALDPACETWVKVRFPITEQEGWVHSNDVGSSFPRGWWN